MTIEEILSPAIDVRSPYAKQMIAALQALVDDERERCNMIVQAARNGDIDGDFRSIAHRIQSGCRLIYEDGVYKDVY